MMKIKSEIWDYPGKMKYIMYNTFLGLALIFFTNIGYLFYTGGWFFGLINLFGLTICLLILLSIRKHSKIEREYKKLKDGKKH